MPTLFKPGTGRRQASQQERDAAQIQRLNARIANLEKAHAEKVARLDRASDGLVCALRKASEQVEQKDRDLNAAVAVAVGRLQKISELEGDIKFQAAKVVRAEGIQRSLAQSLVNAHREIDRLKPKVTTANNPARIPPYAPTDPGEWTVIDAAGQAITFGTGTWMPFPPDPDGETTVGIALADVLAGLS
jgi:hypothetical protein